MDKFEVQFKRNEMQDWKTISTASTYDEAIGRARTYMRLAEGGWRYRIVQVSASAILAEFFVPFREVE